MAGEQYMLYLENKRFANKHDMERRASHPKSYLLSSDETFSNKYQYWSQFSLLIRYLKDQSLLVSVEPAWNVAVKADR